MAKVRDVRRQTPERGRDGAKVRDAAVRERLGCERRSHESVVRDGVREGARHPRDGLF